MYLRNGVWYYDFLVNGVRYKGTTGYIEREKSKAKKAVDLLKAQIREKQAPSLIWAQTRQKLIGSSSTKLNEASVWQEFMKRYDGKGNENRLKSIKMHLGLFLNWMKQNHDVKTVADVTEQHAVAWWNEVRNLTLSNSSKNKYLTSMKMIFRVLGKANGVLENPFAEIKRLANKAAEREAFTPEELRLIGEKAKGWIYSLCLCAISTGLRKKDICLLPKKDVDLNANWIQTTTSKTGASVGIPIMPGLRRHIEEQFAEHPESEYVFPELAKLFLHDEREMSRKIKAFFKSIGIQGLTKQEKGYAKTVSVKDIHSFRHTFVYMAALHGIPFPVVQGIVGHASSSMTKHYMNHASREAKTKYLTQIPAYISGGARVKKSLNDRIIDLLNRTNKENFERTKKRILKFLKKNT